MSQSRASMLLDQMDIHCHENDWFVSIESAFRGITAEEAAWVPPGEGNTIWQIVNHLVFWNADIIHRLNGTTNPRQIANNDETFGEAGDPSDEEGWHHTLHRFRQVLSELREVMTTLDDQQLDSSYRTGSTSIARLLSNVMMHDTYHIGQIVLLRKLRSSWPGYDWS